MATCATVSAVVCFLLTGPSITSSKDQLKADVGDDVILRCRAHREAVVGLEWIRPDLKSHDKVFFYRDNRSSENYQLPSYRGRVELRDSQMKGGDVSVVLKNIPINDAGTYECSVGYGGEPELINTIHLKVEPGATSGEAEDGGNQGVNVRLVVGLSVAAVVVFVCFVGFCCWIFFQKHQIDRTNQVI